MSGKQDDTGAFLRAIQLAMRDEQIPEVTVERVMNRLLYGDPAPAVRRIRQQDAGQVVHVYVNAPAGMDAVRLGETVRALSQRIGYGRL